jgi:hypothetical protein
MEKTSLLAVLFVIALLPLSTNAVTLPLDSAAQSVSLGGSVTVDLNRFGIGDFTVSSLCVFLVEITFI